MPRCLRSGTGMYLDECKRIEVERRFSLSKRKCGMGLITTKLRETATHVIAMSIFLLNLHRIQLALSGLLSFMLSSPPVSEKVRHCSVDIRLDMLRLSHGSLVAPVGLF